MVLWCEKGGLEKLMSIPDNKIIVFDTETTGVNTTVDEILQLAIINGNGQTLFNEFIKPEERTSWPGAQSVNHISPEMVQDKPHFCYFKEQVNRIFQNADLVIGYNLDFDLPLIRKNGIGFQNKTLLFDVMLEYAPVYGQWNSYHGNFRWQKLIDCASHYKYKFKAHDALEDCKATLHCFRAMLKDNEPRGYLELCDYCKGKSVDSWLEERRDRRECEREYLELMYYKRNSENDPVFDKIDDTVYSCFIRGTSWCAAEVVESKYCSSNMDMKIRKATLEAVSNVCTEKGGKLYKSCAKGAKWVIIGESGLCIFDETNRYHDMGYKVARWPEFLEYLGVDEGWNLNCWRKMYSENLQYIHKNNRPVNEKYLEHLRKTAYPEIKIPLSISSNEHSISEKQDVNDVKDSNSLGNRENYHSNDIAQNRKIEIFTDISSNRETPSTTYEKICNEIKTHENNDDQKKSRIASKACDIMNNIEVNNNLNDQKTIWIQNRVNEVALGGRASAYFFFDLRYEITLRNNEWQNDGFLRAYSKYFPEMSIENLQQLREQAIPWLNESNTCNSQYQIIMQDSFVHRYVMIAYAWLERARGFFQNHCAQFVYNSCYSFFYPHEQQMVWQYLCIETEL